MRMGIDRLELSASDLANHLGCHHLIQLELAVAAGNRHPPEWRDPALAVLQQRGLALEQAYLDHLRRQDRRVAELGPDEDGSGLERTISAMRDGADVIYQATLSSGRWHGRADFLKRVGRRSQLGPWSYEVLDAKLARETRAGTVLQLCLYSHLAADIQGILPEYMHVIVPRDDFEPLPFRVQDFLAYYRLVQRQLEAAIDGAAGTGDTYPDLVPHCEICRWWQECDRRRRDDDHLCLVAGISKLQINELRSWGVDTLAALAELPLPLERRPERGAPETYEGVREQARVQLEGRRAGAPCYEVKPVVEAKGFSRLPEP
jgi:predicted RecB family nuclease